MPDRASSSYESVNTKTAIVLLEVFLVAIIAALVITIASVPVGVKMIASGTVSPIAALTALFIFYCRRGMIWAFAGASVLGAVGVILRVIVSTKPSLEVGGGLPVGVTVLYIVLGSFVSLKNYGCVVEMRMRRSNSGVRST
jgi:hypothetical protein